MTRVNVQLRTRLTQERLSGSIWTVNLKKLYNKPKAIDCLSVTRTVPFGFAPLTAGLFCKRISRILTRNFKPYLRIPHR
jgi:hypothetical protein